MIEQLRGRNLAHVGCTLGLALGLALGMIVAIVIISVAASVDWATFAWFAVTFALGGVGYIVGDRGSRRLWRDSSREQHD